MYLVRIGGKFVIEWVLMPVAVGIAGVLSPKLKMNDKKKIEKLFHNLKIGVQEKGKEGMTYPKFYKKTSLENGIQYTFTFPLGLSSKAIQVIQENGKVFSDGLNKPVEVEFDGMLHINVYDKPIPKKWSLLDAPLVEGWKVPIGMSYKGIIWWDTDAIPHMTGGGTTRYGKTVLLKVIQTYLTINNPDDVEFYIIDLKGGLEFHRYQHLKQVKAVATNPVEAAEVLTGIIEEVRMMEGYFKKNYWTNIVNTPLKKRKFVIVDEGAQLAPEKHMSKEMKELLGFSQHALSEIARVAGALGYRLIFCTQYPTADTLPRQIKQNADAKISFRLPSGYASQVTIDEYGAEELPSGLPGRALYKTHELKEIQVPYISDEEMWKLLGVYETNVIIEHSKEETKTGGNLVDLE